MFPCSPYSSPERSSIERSASPLWEPRNPEEVKVKIWLFTLKECVKSASFEFQETLRSLIEKKPDSLGEQFPSFENLLNFLEATVKPKLFDYHPDLERLVESAYEEICSSEEFYDPGYSMQPLDPTPQRISPLRSLSLSSLMLEE